MIKLQNLNGMTQDELQEVIRQRCADCGSVLRVTIIKDDKWSGFALAGVEMAKPEETLLVLERLGDHRLDGLVVIKIEQE